VERVIGGLREAAASGLLSAFNGYVGGRTTGGQGVGERGLAPVGAVLVFHVAGEPVPGAPSPLKAMPGRPVTTRSARRSIGPAITCSRRFGLPGSRIASGLRQ
jgi:hypothetical protein